MGANQSTFDQELSGSSSIYNDSALKYEPRMVRLPVQHHARVGVVHDSKRSNHKGMQLENLPIELCLHILSKLKMNTLLTMARVSKKWNRLANTDIIFQKGAAARFKLHPSRFQFLGMDPSESNHKWKEIYVEMDSGISTWTGFAVDYVTNQGKPYEMELIIKSSDTKLVKGPPYSNMSFYRLSEFQGCCRWKTLADSLTNTVGAIVDPEENSSIRFEVDQFLNSCLSRHITFTETGVVRGLDLVVPNVYQGLVCSNVVLGFYDPGHPDLVGSFICVLQDSLPLDRNYTSKFRSQREYTGIWMSSSDKATYMRFTVESVSSTTIIGTVVLHPFVSCRTTTRSANVDLQKSIILQLKFQIDSSDHKYLRIHGGQFSLISSFNHQIWIQDCIPIMEELHMNIYGDTIIGLFSEPRPGCFFLNPIN